MPSLKAKRKRHLSEAFQTLPSIATPSSLPTVFFLFNYIAYLIYFLKMHTMGQTVTLSQQQKGK